MTGMNFNDVMMCEGVEGYQAETEEEYYAAWQRLIDAGTVWQLQGWFGRTANALIEAGHCTPAQVH